MLVLLNTTPNLVTIIITHTFDFQIAYSKKFESTSPQTYENLLLESYMMLRSSLIGHCVSQSEMPIVNDLLRQSAGLLGNCCALYVIFSFNNLNYPKLYKN